MSMFDVQLDRPNGAYFSGERLGGQIVVKNPVQITITNFYVHIHGEGSTNWLNKTSEQALNFNQIYVDRVVDATTGNRDLPAGTHTFPFYFDLPQGLPSSVEGEFGYIRYTARAVAEVDADVQCGPIGQHASNALQQVVPFKVIAIMDLKQDPNNFRQIESEDSEVFYCCCCIKTGQIIAKVNLPKLGFLMNEPIVINAVIENRTRRKLENASIRVLQHLRFYGQSEFLQTDEMKEVRLMVGGKELQSVEPRSVKSWDNEIIPISNAEQTILPTQVRCAVNIEYTIRLEIEKGPNLDIPIVFGSKL